MKIARLAALALALAALCALPAGASAGNLDTSFGTNGRVTTPFGSADSIALGVAVQRNGRIVAVGADPDPAADSGMLIARYLHSGALDRSFGGDGKVEISFPSSGSAAGLDVAITPRGRILVAGAVNSGAINRNFALVRLLPGGGLDRSFSGDGRVITEFPSGQAEATALARQRDGRIVLAGQTALVGANPAFALARYRPNGGLDRSFGNQGLKITRFGADGAEVQDVAIRANHRIIAAGSAREAQNFGFAQYHPNGSLDKSFGDGGRVIATVGNPFTNIVGARALGLHQGRAIAAGTSKMKFALTRLRPGGAQDRSFGQQGNVFTGFLANGTSGNGMAVGGSGKITVVGGTSSDQSSGFAIAHYRPGGHLDKRFGNGGKLITLFPGADATADAAAIGPKGRRIVVAGGAKAGSAPGRFALARYWIPGL